MGLTNNDIFKKLRVAHKLRDDEIVDICKLVSDSIATYLLLQEKICKLIVKYYGIRNEKYRYYTKNILYL